MKTQPKNKTSKTEEKDDENVKDQNTGNNTNDAVEDDGTPVLDEEDLEENNINEEEAEDIEWKEPKGK